MGKKSILKKEIEANKEEDSVSSEEEEVEEVEEESMKEESIKEESKKEEKKNRREIQNEEGISSKPNTGVVYVGHLPWGFIDSTLKKYFSQFGNITRIICPKSSKTGRSVGYAFIEFEEEETARIAAKTMNNYILFEKILKCSFVEDKKKYDRIFLKWKKKFEFKEKYKAHCEKLEKKKSKDEIKLMIQGLLDSEERRREKMKELGIKYEYKGFKDIVEQYKKENSIKNNKNKYESINKKEEKEDKNEKEKLKGDKKINKKSLNIKENKTDKKVETIRKKQKILKMEEKEKKNNKKKIKN